MEERFYVENLGCAKNQVDAEIIISALGAEGYERAESADEADLIIVNSCGFVEAAKKEAIDAVMAARDRFPRKKILLAGCLAERYGETLKEIMPEADGFFGNRDVSRISEAVRSVLSGSRPAIFPAGYSSCEGIERSVSLSLPGSAYVKVSEGCDNRCSYCAIPRIRGPLRSRPVRSVVREAAALLARGFAEIVLVGQDLGSYGFDLTDDGTGSRCLLPNLLAELSALSGEFWIRLLYIHPDHFPPALLDACAADPRIVPYFDIPVQHASSSLLSAMNRKGDGRRYLDLISSIRAALDEAIIRSTFLVGFPGETDGDFDALRDFQENAEIDWLGVFAYSKEEDTAAYESKAARVESKLALARKAEIEHAQVPITEKRLGRFVGRALKVLVEEEVKGGDLYLCRAYLQAPDVDGLTVLRSPAPLVPGRMMDCRILRVNGVDLEAIVNAGE